MNTNQVVDATVQIRFGGERVGSGFRFFRDDIIVSCAHIFPAFQEDVLITADDGRDTERTLELVDFSPEPEAGGFDYAIFRAEKGFPETSAVLHSGSEEPAPGDEVVFAGHPFHITDTLLHTAVISGDHQHGFYLDGSVNLGNSGGPVVDADSGDVVGIITESKIYQDSSLGDLIDDLYRVQQQLSRINEVHDTTINDVDMEQLAIDSIQTIQDGLDILSENISSGIGVGYNIRYVLDGLEDISED